MAAELGVHPQTVRYRMRTLERLFGSRLENGEERLGIEVALRAARLQARTQNSGMDPQN
ncbi:helix-turn-helix domain-containing protein [Streptacidiphilus jiangxiensis]|uniref:PucR C-terminal helix-turn-helix domain-containing protein n=1 Tax=Streptacidiphilus jiangxiensis TaxID=235985 RepID=A0A1H7MR31_STRJI|nr:PucR C-terminal helix-turn-helix domain-containing protein [Streptacidiphilus jiangxiensis]